MKSDRVLCKPDETNQTLLYVAEGLGDNPNDYWPCLALNISLNGKTIAGVLLNDLRPGRDVWMTIYSSDKRWATRSVIKYVFGIIFNLMNCKRASVFVTVDNFQSLKMCERLGFKKEGCLRQFRDDGKDCFVMGMLKQECKWHEQKEKSKL